MQKFVKAVVIFVFVVLLLLIISPYLFRGRVVEFVKSEINSNLNARVEFSSVGLSLLRNFPNLTVSLYNLTVTGVDSFENDTLVSLNSFRAVADIKTLFRKNPTVKSILINSPRINTLVNQIGEVNWDIVKPDMFESDELEEKADDQSVKLSVTLDKIEIRNGRFIYDDIPLKYYLSLDDINLVSRGTIAMDLSTFKITGVVQKVNTKYASIPYLSDVKLELDTYLDFESSDFKFSFRESNASLNLVDIALEGFFSMPDTGMETNIVFNTTNREFKSLISLIPAIYLNQFDKIETWGGFYLEGFVIGKIGDGVVPSVGIKMEVTESGFKYPSLPGSVDNLSLELDIFYDGVDEDNSRIGINKFFVEMAGNPLEADFTLTTPFSDPEVIGKLNGILNLTSMHDIIHLDPVQLRGLIEADFSFGGRMSYIENKQYNNFKATGGVRGTALSYSAQDFPLNISIPAAALKFSSQFVELEQFELFIDDSDLNLDGRIENVFTYLFNDGILQGDFNMKSTLIDLNTLLEIEQAETSESSEFNTFDVPGNVDFSLKSDIKTLVFGNLEFENFSGAVIIRDKKIALERVDMLLLGGAITATGAYYSDDLERPGFDFDLGISNLNIPLSFHTFNSVQKLAPIAEGLDGYYSASIKMRSKLDNTFSLDLSTLEASGRIVTSGVELISSDLFESLSTALSLSDRRSNVLKDLDLSFAVKDGRVTVEPFNINIGQIKMVVGGDQGIDRTMNYSIELSLPRELMGSDANQFLNNLTASARNRGLDIDMGETININATVMGAFNDPKFAFDLRESASGFFEQVTEQARTAVSAQVDRITGMAEDVVIEQSAAIASRVIIEAEREAGLIIKRATEAADKIKSEGELAAQKIELEAEGRGIIARTAAKRTADALRREAERNGDALIAEANERAAKLLGEAQTRADSLLKN